MYAETAKQFEWQVSVIKDDKTQNAFALPGGKIAVYTGIFPVAQNEAGLAAILGHEVTHALARHGGERMSQGMVAQGVVVAATLGAASQGIRSEWQLSVIKDDKTQNAFALPGGKIAVYTGIFPVAQNEAGLAAILGHEVTHALARHGGERMSQGMVAQGVVVAATLGAASQGI